jgi:hypothetical protein
VKRVHARKVAAAKLDLTQLALASFSAKNDQPQQIR